MQASKARKLHLAGLERWCMGLATLDSAYWWTPLATDALQRAGASASPLPEGFQWTPQHVKATKAFQKMARLAQDGDPGPNTIRELRAVVGPLTITGPVAAKCLSQVLHQTSVLLASVYLASTTSDEWAKVYGPKLVTIANDFANAWDDKCPEATTRLFTYAMTPEQKAAWLPEAGGAEVGVAPLAAPLLIAAWSEAAAVAAAEVTVAALGAAVTVASAAWLADRVKGWIIDAAPTAPESMTAKGQVKIAPPAHLSRIGSPPPPKFDFDWTGSPIKSLLKYAAKFFALALAWLVGAAGVVASLFGPVVTAAAGVAGSLFWILLAALGAFLASRKRRGW